MMEPNSSHKFRKISNTDIYTDTQPSVLHKSNLCLDKTFKRGNKHGIKCLIEVKLNFISAHFTIKLVCVNKFNNTNVLFKENNQ